VSECPDFCVCQAEHCRTSLEASRKTNTELTDHIEEYAQKLKDVINFFLIMDHFLALKVAAVTTLYSQRKRNTSHYYLWLMGNLVNLNENSRQCG